MKNKLTLFLLLAGLLMMGEACSDLLDNPDPSTSISQDAALSDEGAIRSLRASMYGWLQQIEFSTTYMLGPEAQADNLFNRDGSSRLQGFSQNQLRAGVGTGSYDDAYNLILDANLLAEGIEEGVISDDLRNQFRGEGLVMRAFAMHYLVKAFGYDPGAIPSSGQGAGWDLGIIIRTSPTLTLNDADARPRNTVAEVYAQMVSDLQEAASLLENQFTDPGFATHAFAQALLARVQLYNRNWSAADQAATNALGANGAPGLATDSATVAQMFNENGPNHPESFFTAILNSSTEQISGSNVNNGLNAYTADQWNAQVPTQDLRDLYDAADYRNAWYAPCFEEANNSDCTGSAITGEEIQKWNGDKGNFGDDIPYLRAAELKLIQAEARARDAGAVTASALSPLNDLRQARGLTAFVLADFASLDEFINEVLDERRRELVAEGHRYFDLKRLARDIRKAPETGFPNVPFTDRRILDDFNSGQLEANPELQQNPGY